MMPADRKARLDDSIKSLDERAAEVEADPTVRRHVARTSGDGRFGSWKREIDSTRGLAATAHRFLVQSEKPPRRATAVRAEQPDGPNKHQPRNQVLIDLGFVREADGLWTSDGLGSIRRSPARRWYAKSVGAAPLKGPFRTALDAAEALVKSKGDA